jgi:hypothetical protein
MNWIHIIGAGILASVLTSFTDWYFFGILFHDRYSTNAGVWRQYKDKNHEMRSIAIGILLGTLTNFIFIISCSYLRLVGLPAALAAAGVLWVMIPIPLLLTNSIFMRIDRALVVSHSLGWLARLIVSALCVSWFLK